MFTQEELNAIYDEALEGDTRRFNPEIRKVYDELYDLFEKHMALLEMDNFKWGYQLGYEAGRASV